MDQEKQAQKPHKTLGSRLATFWTTIGGTFIGLMGGAEVVDRARDKRDSQLDAIYDVARTNATNAADNLGVDASDHARNLAYNHTRLDELLTHLPENSRPEALKAALAAQGPDDTYSNETTHQIHTALREQNTSWMSKSQRNGNIAVVGIAVATTVAALGTLHMFRKWQEKRAQNKEQGSHVERLEAERATSQGREASGHAL